jgi:hypothetical protein
MRRALLAVPLLVLALTASADAQRRSVGPVLHEPIPPDPREDMALSIAVDGDLPAAIQTPRGLVPAPDPSRPVGEGESPYGPTPSSAAPDSEFRPDRDTRRPDVLPYDDPFSPSTAPFKRLSAYDAVDANYTLFVRNAHTVSLPVSATPPPPSGHEHFYGDMVVDVAPGRKVRIPSVGPGARLLRARAGIGAADVRLSFSRDGAENWFVQADTTARVRLVMELSILRAAFGGDFGNPSWAELPPVAPLPPTAARSAAEVASRIGVSRALSPRDAVTKLVAYFRSFTESDEPPPPGRDIYLDLALSRKGVCRHRAFAFLVTALHLRLPTRMIANEAHAWVEVHDGRLWRRIDLGGAGRTLHDPTSSNVPYDPPPDAFSWPEGASRGSDMADRSRAPDLPGAPRGAGGGDAGAGDSAPDPAGGGEGGGPGAPGSGGATLGGGPGGGDDDPTGPGGPSAPGQSPGQRSVAAPAGPDDRPASTVTMVLGSGDARRGAPLRVSGEVHADGDPCGHVTVDVVLRGRALGEITIGQLATGPGGRYDGALVLPTSVPLGDYEVWGHTRGDSRCGRGRTR